MSINVIQASDGWYVDSGSTAVRIDTNAETTRELLEDRQAIDAAAAGDAEHVDVASLSVLSPITAPCRLVAQMLNYRSHAIDSGLDPDTVPSAFFRKSSESITGPTGQIQRPAHVKFLDYEVELGLVFGSTMPVGAEVESGDLSKYIAGIVIANDVSARDLQLTKTQFYESKSYPTFTPLGPRLTLLEPHEYVHLNSLRLTLDVNGSSRQNSTTADMIVKPAAALTTLAGFQKMEPGDVLLTGTPGGTALRAPAKPLALLASLLPPKKRWELFFAKQANNPAYLSDGDLVTTRIASTDGAIDLGSQRNLVGTGDRR